MRRSQWPRGIKRRSAAARLLRLWVRIPPEAWMSVCCECCVFTGKGLCDELITRPEESYRLWCVVCDLETSGMRRPWPTAALAPKRNKQSPWVWVWNPGQKFVRLIKSRLYNNCRSIANTWRLEIKSVCKMHDGPLLLMPNDTAQSFMHTCR